MEKRPKNIGEKGEAQPEGYSLSWSLLSILNFRRISAIEGGLLLLSSQGGLVPMVFSALGNEPNNFHVKEFKPSGIPAIAALLLGGLRRHGASRLRGPAVLGNDWQVASPCPGSTTK